MTREHNTAVHPARYTTEAMLRIKNNLIRGGQKRVWDALYQQNPIPDEGNYFSKEMFSYYGSAPARDELYVYQAWDFAISEGKESDYTVGVTLGQDHRDNLYALDIRRFKTADGILLAETLVDYAVEWNADLLGFEDGQIWKSIETQFLKACETKRQYPSYEVLKPLTDKMVRANPLKGRMQAKKVYFDRQAVWWTECFKELLHFPAGKHDDQVDALAWAVRLTLSRAAPKRKDTAPKIKSWKDKLPGMARGAGSHMSA
jgi:predicted phage terminase large subunit-like protein